MEEILIFDTTLRDGEQSPGASLNLNEKLEIARQLERLRVDVIEAGFPFASPGDFEAVQLIAKKVKDTGICALCRTNEEDIMAAYEAIKAATAPRIHTFIATSDLHMKHKLRMTRQEVLDVTASSVSLAKRKIPDVEFSAEDATRSDVEFLCEVIDTAIKAGANVINIPDTVGYTTPFEYGELIKTIRRKVPRTEGVILSVHCHNDLGLAVSNSISAIQSGVKQVECTLNGIGERAGNASLEEIVMILYTRRDYFKKTTRVNTREIFKTSRLVSKLTGITVQPNKAIVGANAFLHEAGIHQDGILKERRTYEIMNAETIGLVTNQIVLGKHSGRHALRKRIEELGFSLSDEEINKTFAIFKDLADKKKEIFDEDLMAIIEDEVRVIPQTFSLVYINTTSGSHTIPTATVRIRKGKRTLQEAACGNGPVDASYKAIDKITGIACELLDYSLHALTSKRDALGEVTLRIRHKGEIVIGRGTSTDVVEASAKAYLNAVNKIVYREKGECGKDDI
jgi:2-isopropylmalate synthase